MNSYYSHVNRFGTWLIYPVGQLWEVAYGDEPLGRYNNLEGAHEDLVRGYCFSLSNGLDPEQCELPDDLADWERVHVRHR